MRFDVLLADAENDFHNAKPAPDIPLAGYPAYYTQLLTRAEEEKAAVLDLQGIGSQGIPSKDFQYMGTIEQTVMEFLKVHRFPETVRILCRDEKELTAYMAVYNFWYAENKASRLNNGKWD